MGVSEPRAAEGLVSREDLGQETEFGSQKDHLQGLRQRVLHADQVEKVLLLQKHMQTYRALEAKAADLDQENLNEKRMSIRPKKEEEAQKRISDMYGYCQDNFFRASQNAVAKRLGEQPVDVGKQETNKQTVPAPSWLRGRKKKDYREER